MARNSRPKAALLLAGLLLAGCLNQAAKPATRPRPGPSSSSARAGSGQPPSSSSTLVVTTSPAKTTGSPVAAWLASERAFYRAGQSGSPDYPPLLSSFAPSSPALKSVVSFLTALRAAGVVAPSSYRLGDGRLLSEAAGRAVVTGCAFDTGSIYRTTRQPAPAALGGGAGFTAYRVTLLLRSRRWLVWSVFATSSSSKGAGPCENF